MGKRTVICHAQAVYLIQTDRTVQPTAERSHKTYSPPYSSHLHSALQSSLKTNFICPVEKLHFTIERSRQWQNHKHRSVGLSVCHLYYVHVAWRSALVTWCFLIC